MKHAESNNNKLCARNFRTRVLDFLICSFGVALIATLVLTGRWIKNLDGDAVPQTYSLFVDAFNSLKNGEWPLWNSSLWDGLPSYAIPITQAMYPINWLLCAIFYNAETDLVSYMMIAWNLILHLSLLYTGAYFLCRRCDLSQFASACAAFFSVLNMSVMNGSIMIWVVSLDGLCYIPWVIYFSIGLIDAGDKWDGIKNAVYLGIVFGLIALISVSALPIPAMLLIFLCVSKLVEMIQQKDMQLLKRYIGHVLLAAVIAVLLCASTLFGYIVLAPNVSRFVDGIGFLYAGDTFDFYEFSHRASGISSMQNLVKGNSEYSMASIPLTALIFGFFGMFSNKVGYKKNFMLFSFAYTFLYMFGIIVLDIAFWIPGLNASRHPYLYAPYVTLFFSILAGYGMDQVNGMLCKDEILKYSAPINILLFGILLSNILDPDYYERPHKILAAILMVMLGLIIARGYLLKAPQRRNVLIRAISIGVVVCLGFEVCIFYRSFQQGKHTMSEASDRVEEYLLDTSAELSEFYEEDLTSRITDWLSTCYPSNIASAIGFNQVMGYINPGYDKPIRVHLGVELNKRCQLQNIRYVLDVADLEGTAVFEEMYPNFELVKTLETYPSYESEEKVKVNVYDTNSNLGSAWLVSEIMYYDSETSHSQIFSDLSAIDLSTTALVDRDSDYGETLIVEKAEQTVGSVKCIQYKHNSVIYAVNSDETQLLVTAENNYPGWKAYIDGEEKQVLNVNYLKRGVVVEQGNHLVEFRFEPIDFKIAVACGVIGTILVVYLLALVEIKKKQK